VVSNRFIRVVVIWCLILLTVWLGDRFVRSVVLTTVEPRAVTPRGSLAEFELHAIELFEKLAPSVVYIVTEAQHNGGWGLSSGRLGAGSGFIWDAAGHVVTNFHVLSGADRIFVRVRGNETVPARLVGAARDYDLAVLKLVGSRAQLLPIPIGTSADLRVGQAVFAIGNPYGLSRTLTTGVISALDRRLPTGANREIRGVIQTDAAINPGNSGGPLLDSAGRLIGVNAAILSESGASAGIGFSVPVDVVNRVVPALIAKGRVERPGIGILALSEEFAARAGIAGIIIDRVLPGTSAAAAGLQGVDRSAGRLGDVITHVNGYPVRSIEDLAAELQNIGVGESADLTVLRDGVARVVQVLVMDVS
jgi:2-alkenal reductase